jgi:hypothetical protein
VGGRLDGPHRRRRSGIPALIAVGLGLDLRGQSQKEDDVRKETHNYL